MPLTRPTSICEFCQKCIVQSEDIAWGYHHPDIQSLRSHAAHNCFFCSDLYTSVLCETDASKISTFPQYIWSIGRPIQIRNQPQTFSITFRSDPGVVTQHSDRLTVPAESGGDLKEFCLFQREEDDNAKSSFPGVTTRSAETQKLARQWMSKCLNSHEACTMHRDDSIQDREFLPTRLVELLDNEVGDRKITRVRVIETDHMSSVPYMTLSHCWGDAVNAMLTSESISEYTNEIAIERLDRTFQEAIEVCASLGLRYIWIDSLCIIQKNRPDWHREAPRMHKVYRYSHCNIAATESKMPSEGIFRTRDKDRLVFPECRAEPPTRLLGNQSWSIVPKDFWHRKLRSRHLYSRAWVFQERMLAPRILHFGADQVFWSCSSMEACETFHRGVPPFLIDPADYSERLWRARLRESTSLDYRPRPGSVNAMSPYSFWMYAVDYYSRCNLTNPADKLIAIWGVAKLIGEALGEKHIAGLWQKSFVNQLAWRVVDGQNGNGKPSKRLQWPDGFHIPSWSWGSMNAVIRLYHRNSGAPEYIATTHDGDEVVSVFETPHETAKRKQSAVSPAASPELLQEEFNAFEEVLSRHNSEASVIGTAIAQRLSISGSMTPPATTTDAHNRHDQPPQLLTSEIPITSEIGLVVMTGSTKPWQWTFDLPGTYNVFPDVDPGPAAGTRTVLFTILSWSEIIDDSDEEQDYIEEEDEEDADSDNAQGSFADEQEASPHRAAAFSDGLKDGLGIRYEDTVITDRFTDQSVVHKSPTDDNDTAAATLQNSPKQRNSDSPNAEVAAVFNSPTSPSITSSSPSPISAPPSSDTAQPDIEGFGLLLHPSKFRPTHFQRAGTFTFAISNAQAAVLDDCIIKSPEFCGGFDKERGHNWWLE